MLYLWDSNILRHYADGNLTLHEKLQRVTPSVVALPSVVMAETLRGRSEYALKATPEQSPFAHDLLLKTLQMIQRFQILPFDQQSATVMANLKKQHRAHKLHADLMIAAVAIAGKHIVVTRNVKHFIGLLPQDQIQNWIDEPLGN